MWGSGECARGNRDVIGVLGVVSESANAYDEMDLIVLQSLADQAAVALENARLYAETHRLAVLEERQRLARELHDSVPQALYGLTLYTAANRSLLAAGDRTTAANHLSIMQETAQLALSEMRLLIFQLRSPTLSDGLATALQERLEAVEQRSGIKTTFTSSGSGCVDAQIDEDLYRIAQEALNILKDSTPQDLVDVIRQVRRGEVSLHPTIARKVLHPEQAPLSQPDPSRTLCVAQRSGPLDGRCVEQVSAIVHRLFLHRTS